MTELLCSWLNEDIKLEKSISKDTFENEFSNGYLIGEILNKHGLQDDFNNFSKGKSSESKLNNFMKLEPSLRLLQIPFDANTIYDIIIGRSGAATKLLYQIYIALKKKKENNWTSQTMEVMRPQARAKLEKIQTEFFQQRLKQQVPRQVDLTFKELIEKFEQQRKKREDIITHQEQHEQNEIMAKRRTVCQESLQQHRQMRVTQAEMYKKLSPLDLPTVKEKQVSRAISRERERRKKERLLEDTMRDIAEFEDCHNLSPIAISPSVDTQISPQDKKVTIASDEDYFGDIKTRISADVSARRDRSKRRRKLLVDQMRLMNQKEDEQKEHVMAERLMRQSLQEKRIATQLMQIRKEKDNIRNNRIERQKQYEEERNRMFQEALDREAAMIAREKEEHKVMLKAQKENRKKLLLQRARDHYEKHYSMMMEIVKEIVTITTKVGEYRILTDGSIPDKLVRDWKLLFIKGKPLYDDDLLLGSTSTQDSLTDLDGNDILDNADLKEYLQVTNEWSVTESDPISNLPSQPNTVLTHIVHRLIDSVTPPQPLPSPPPFPKFQLKGSFLGLPYTGKTTILNKLHESMELIVLCPCKLVEKALQAYTTERIPTPTQQEDEEQKTNENTQEENKITSIDSDEQIKDIEAVIDGEEALPVEPLQELSEIAQLGVRVFTCVTNGEAVDDEIVVDIILNEIRTLEDGSSWILDNYPTTLRQAQLLATGLTGQGATALKEQSHSAQQRSQDFLLIPKREVKEEELMNLSAACGLDVVIHFDATVDTVLARSTQYQKTMTNPPDIQECLLSYDINWPCVNQWFNQFCVLTVINANDNLSTVSEQAHNGVMEKLTKLQQIETMKKIGIKLTLDDNDNMGLASKSAVKFSKGGNKVKKESTKKSASSPRLRKRRPSSAGSIPVWDQVKGELVPQGRRSAEEILFELMDPSVQPGDPKWVYLDEGINSEMIQSLSQRWPMAEKIYSSTFLGVFRQLRQERDDMCHYLYNRREEFSKYLKRPDNKQEFVSQWQSSYNEIEQHLRQEDIMKAELHHRVEDLIDALWDICERRKKEAEQERENIINDQWLINKMGLVCNHYISLMNSELTRFQDTVILLKDYYTAMQSDCPIASLPNNINDRIPLIELPNAPKPSEPPSARSSQQTINQQTDDTEKNEDDQEQKVVTERKKRVTLVQREPPVVPDPAVEEKTKRKSTLEQILPPREDIADLELDEQLIVHSYNTAIAGIFHCFTSEIAIIETASAEANKAPTPPPPAATEPKRDKSGGKGNKKGGKSPVSKKGGKSPKDKKGDAPPTTTPVRGRSLSPEQLAKKQQMERMRKEHTYALKHEEGAIKARLQLIKIKALEFISYLKSQTSTLYKKMEDWIGVYYEQEVKSVNQLGEVLRCAIERESKLKYELVLPGVNFQIYQNILMYPPTPPVTPPPPREPIHPIHFTSLQLMSLYDQLRAIAPDGVITVQSLITFIHALVNKSYGENIFPLMWIGLSKDVVSQICYSVYGKRADLIQWFRFIQCVAQPYTIPTSQNLLAALDKFKTLSKNTDQLIQQPLWFNEEDIRERIIKQLIIDAHILLHNQLTDPVGILFQFCASPNVEEGIHKAFTLAAAIDNTPTDDNILVSIDVLQKVLVNGSHDNEFTSEVIEKLYHGIKREQATPVPQTTSQDTPMAQDTPISHDTLIPLNILLQDESILEYLDTCINYHLPDAAVFIRPSSVEPPNTPTPS